jgi:HNH endonuclease
MYKKKLCPRPVLVCEECHNRFDPIRRSKPQRFCSITCYNINISKNRVKHHCQDCGTRINRKISGKEYKSGIRCTDCYKDYQTVLRSLRKMVNDIKDQKELFDRTGQIQNCFIDSPMSKWITSLRKHENKIETRQTKYETNLSVDHICKYCRGIFHTHKSGIYVFCSDRCNARWDKRVAGGTYKQRIERYGGKFYSFNPLAVLERDGWLCQSCGVETPKELRGTFESNAPELDHIVPVSKAGDHSMSNTQCLCRSCNNKKSNKLSA